MLIIRRAQERGFTNLGWLKSSHTFSFGGYFDPLYLGFESLRVINDDHVAPGSGFSAHAHRDMEILSYVLSGALKHRDNMGNEGVIKAQDVQRMSAGTGVIHSEANASDSEDVHFLQIWIIPTSMGITPSYEQKHFSQAQKRGRFVLIASSNGRDGSLLIHQDTDVWSAILDKSHPTLTYTLSRKRKAWIHIVRGELSLNDTPLKTGDGVGITSAQTLHFHKPQTECEILVFDLVAS
jgi:redox-sensitive bicupin YhaK (pirin superfamily)